VLDGSAHPDGLTLGVVLESSQSVHPPLLAVALSDDLVLLVEPDALSQHIVCEIVAHQGLPLGVDESEPAFHRTDVSIVDSEDAIELVRTHPKACREVRDETAQPCNRLRF